MNIEPEPIELGDTVCFSCHSERACFNQCCKDLNQFLYPYDIIRLKTGLNLSSNTFLDQYAIIYTGDSTGLPIVSLKTTNSDGHACPFLSSDGCTVYSNRPASCRLFPLARAISRNRKTGNIKEHYALIKDPICQGFVASPPIQVETWIEDQELMEYNRLNDQMIQLISKKQQIMPGPLSSEHKKAFILACYNIDEFQKEVLTKNCDDPAGIFEDIGTGEKLDDIDWLERSIKWIQVHLFGNI